MPPTQQVYAAKPPTGPKTRIASGSVGQASMSEAKLGPMKRVCVACASDSPRF
jgi:hypothetical protein